MRNLVLVKARLARGGMLAIGQSASEPEPHRVRSESLAIGTDDLDAQGRSPMCCQRPIPRPPAARKRQPKDPAGASLLGGSFAFGHACGYKLANDGRDTRAIQAYLGHRNIQNTTRYTALAPQRFKEFFRD